MALDNLKLGDLLKQVQNGRVQLPDFQREWKWDDDRIRSLLATVTLDYPLGVVMTLETGGEVQFKARALAGTTPVAGTVPEQLLLDGQQRLTSLYQALLSKDPVATEDARHNKLSRWYYIDIAKAIDENVDREDAILSVPADRTLREDFARKVKLDLSSRAKECAAGVFPLNLTFDIAEVNAWQRAYVSTDDDRWNTWPSFEAQVLHRITGFGVPQIKLPKETHKEAVCAVFEKVNTGGVVLNVFELLTATYAGNRHYAREVGHDFNLAENWRQIKAALSARNQALDGLDNVNFLQALTLVFTYERKQRYRATRPDSSIPPAVGCKRKDLLDLPLEAYRTWVTRVGEAFEWIGDFLAEQSVFRKEDLPYQTQLAPLAAIKTILGARADEPGVRRALTQWYWCGVLGELYSGSTESRFARDVEQVVGWVHGDREPDTVAEANFREQRLRALATRNSAAYKGIYALLIKQGCYDWYHVNGPMTEEIVVGQGVDFRLVFPKALFQRNGQKDERINSVVNKTPLSFRASQLIAGRSPAAYLDVIARTTGSPPDWVDDLVATHLIDPKTMRAADFDAFYRDRTERLLTLVERAMGKSAVRDARYAGDSIDPVR